eukprot:196289-Prorocentrum_minimum.AAC.2
MHFQHTANRTSLVPVAFRGLRDGGIDRLADIDWLRLGGRFLRKVRGGGDDQAFLRRKPGGHERRSPGNVARQRLQRLARLARHAGAQPVERRQRRRQGGHRQLDGLLPTPLVRIESSGGGGGGGRRGVVMRRGRKSGSCGCREEEALEGEGAALLDSGTERVQGHGAEGAQQRLFPHGGGGEGGRQPRQRQQAVPGEISNNNKHIFK